MRHCRQCGVLGSAAVQAVNEWGAARMVFYKCFSTITLLFCIALVNWPRNLDNFVKAHVKCQNSYCTETHNILNILLWVNMRLKMYSGTGLDYCLQWFFQRRYFHSWIESAEEFYGLLVLRHSLLKSQNTETNTISSLCWMHQNIGYI